MYLYNIIKTFFSRALILLINFFMLILTTHLWGAEGKGIISIMIANMSIIAIINNVIGGGSISYYISKVGLDKLILPSYIWILICTIICTIIVAVTQSTHYIFYLLVMTLLNSLFSMHLSLFTGKENFKLYNIYSLLLPVLLVIFTLFFEFIVGLKSIRSYIYGYIAALFIVWLVSLFNSLKLLPIKKVSFSFDIVKQVIRYGWQIELSSFLQFINYRLSYFFILYYSDIRSVGLFSVGIALAESVWMISRSISIVLYARIINNPEGTNIDITKSSAKLSFIFSSLLAIIMLLMPSSVYGFIFGQDFVIVKGIMVLIFPGIIAGAVSLIYGHYFSATYQNMTLIIKSTIGIIFTIGLSVLLIPKMGINGACITVATSYTASSIYLMLKFYKITKFNIKDFVITKSDMMRFKP